MQYQKYSRAEKERFCSLLNKGHSVKELVEQLSIPIANLYRWNSLYKSRDTLERHYSPGRKRVLCKEEETKLIETLEKTPELSNQDLAAVVDNKISPSTYPIIFLDKILHLLEKLHQMKSKLMITKL